MIRRQSFVCLKATYPKAPSDMSDPISVMRYIRVTENMFQSELAEIFGVDECTIWNWENGNTYPEKKDLIRIEKWNSLMKII